ncbi:MAG TPA: hypothetical protein VGQ28_00340 [Thermoanaerobaculia bacterium]|jgi:hypothetical protein|nr:hypothetical protein [Thermoanaerobaculia bacterium]
MTFFHRHRTSALAGAAAFAGLILISATPASACSMCRCGDPTFNALGTDVYNDGAFRVALDWERFAKQQGILPEEGATVLKSTAADLGHESVVENRFTTALSYTFRDRVVAVARVPFTSRDMTAPEGRSSQDGLSDPELYALARVWSSEFAPGMGRRAWISVLGGVKTAWGQNDAARGGERLDEHLQPGTGSTDWFGGLSGVYLYTSRSSLFGSTQYRRTGTNSSGYKYGNIAMANIGYEHKLGKRFDGALELNFRDAGRDVMDGSGAVDPNTGGSLLYLSPKLIVDLSKGLVGRLAIQIPVADGLNGEQKEKAVANFGFTYLF